MANHDVTQRLAGSYDFLNIDRVVWGKPVAGALAQELQLRDAARVAVVASPSLWSIAAIRSEIEKAIGPRLVTTFLDLEPHVPRTAVLACVDRLRAADADIVVTIGGGTPIDTVKMALLVMSAGHTDFDQLAISTDADGSRTIPRVPNPPLRQITIPTTLSGAEFSDLAGCVDPGRSLKQLFSAPLIGSATVIYDPRLAVHTPFELWASTGIRALDHAVESLCSTAPNAFTDATAIGAIELLARSLRETNADPTNDRARSDSQQGVWLACAGLNRVPWGASHGIGHQVGAVSGAPHGYTSCVLLPHVLRHNRPVTERAQQRAAVALGAPEGDPADTIRDLVVSLGLPTRLRDIGATEEQLPLIAENSLPNMFVRQNPRPLLSVDDVLQILRPAF